MDVLFFFLWLFPRDSVALFPRAVCFLLFKIPPFLPRLKLLWGRPPPQSTPLPPPLVILWLGRGGGLYCCVTKDATLSSAGFSSASVATMSPHSLLTVRNWRAGVCIRVVSAESKGYLLHVNIIILSHSELYAGPRTEPLLAAMEGENKMIKEPSVMNEDVISECVCLSSLVIAYNPAGPLNRGSVLFNCWDDYADDFKKAIFCVLVLWGGWRGGHSSGEWL